MVMASATRLAAPRAEPALPPRNRAAATTGAASGVLTVAASAFSPRTSNDFEAILACPNAAPCLLAPYTRRCTEATSMNASASGAGQQRCLGSESGQQPAVHRSELAHVAVVERPQERPQRRGSADPAERGGDRAMSQHVHPVDTVRPGDHPGHQRTDLQLRVRADLGGHAHLLGDQLFQPHVLSQPDRRHQPGMRHEIRVIKRHMRPDRGNNRIPEVPFRRRVSGRQQLRSSQVKGHFCCHDTLPATIRAVDPGSGTSPGGPPHH
jgi:hypothetical protein